MRCGAIDPAGVISQGYIAARRFADLGLEILPSQGTIKQGILLRARTISRLDPGQPQVNLLPTVRQKVKMARPRLSSYWQAETT